MANWYIKIDALFAIVQEEIESNQSGKGDIDRGKGNIVRVFERE